MACAFGGHDEAPFVSEIVSYFGNFVFFAAINASASR
jgi:hypothetical protein